MSPVFRHGRLRLYLLKLLDEAPRHGYEIIRLLQDRFLGVYAPSPGTIYPRLARLEEEGLVTHDEADGRKVYRITDRGREELRARLDDLAELEETITASVRDIAREVTEDVRETVRSLREELAWAARDIRGRAHSAPAGDGRTAGAAAGKPAEEASGPGASQEEAARHEEDARQAGAADQADVGGKAGEAGKAGAAGEAPEGAREPGAESAEGRRQRAGGSARGSREEARRGRDRMREGRYRGHRPGTGGRDWSEWAGWGSWGGWHGEGGPHGWADPHAYRDMEKIARQFSRELRNAAEQAQAVSEDAVRELRGILDETIDRIKNEVFRGRPTPPPDDPGE